MALPSNAESGDALQDSFRAPWRKPAGARKQVEHPGIRTLTRTYSGKASFYFFTSLPLDFPLVVAVMFWIVVWAMASRAWLVKNA